MQLAYSVLIVFGNYAIKYGSYYVRHYYNLLRMWVSTYRYVVTL